MVHSRLTYRIPLLLGILTALTGCGGGDAKQADVDALRQEVAALKEAQAETQRTLAALQAAARAAATAPPAAVAARTAGAMPAAPGAADASPGEAERSPVHVIPIAFSPRKGDEITAVTVVEFADFQCPYCQGAARLPDMLLKEFPGDVKFVFKHYPLGRHRDAFQAATAAWAAHQQGKFWEMHDLIYGGDIAQIPVETLRGYAEKLGLDVQRFDEDMNSPKAAHAISFDKMLGKRLKVGGTPVYFVNGKRLTNNSPAGLRAMVAEEIAKTKPGAQS